MKKKRNGMIGLILAIGMMLTSVLVPNVQAAAASVEGEAVHIHVKSSDSFLVRFDQGDYQIANVTSSNANLVCRTTYTYVSSDEQRYSDLKWGSGRISLFAKKKGTYTVDFDVIGRDKAVRSHHSVKVYANDEMAIKKATFAGSEDNFYRISGKTKGKFKVAMTKGYKLLSIKMVTYDKDGQAVEKTIKNGKSVKLGKYRYRSKGNKSESSEWWYANLLASTSFSVTYTDKYTKLPKTTTYYTYCVPSN